MTSPIIPAAYQALIDSPRVSTATRQVLCARAAPDDPAYRPIAITPAQLNTLRAVAQRVIPQPPNARIDIAARLDAQLAKGEGDGWRFAILPDDATAFSLGLDSLDAQARASHGVAFTDLPDALQDNILTRAAAGDLPGTLGGTQMRRWFEDLRAEAVKVYMAHPATLAAIGYSGIAYAGDGATKPGFDLIGLDARESWEPLPNAAKDTP